MTKGWKGGGDDMRILHPDRLSIGEGCVFQDEVVLEAGGGLTIGDNVRIGYRAMILTSDLAYGRTIEEHDAGPIRIEDNVRIGAGAIILKNVILREGCRVMPGAVVTRSVEPWAMVAGNPAKEVLGLTDRESGWF